MVPFVVFLPSEMAEVLQAFRKADKEMTLRQFALSRSHVIPPDDDGMTDDGVTRQFWRDVALTEARQAKEVTKQKRCRKAEKKRKGKDVRAVALNDCVTLRIKGQRVTVS